MIRNPVVSLLVISAAAISATDCHAAVPAAPPDATIKAAVEKPAPAGPHTLYQYHAIQVAAPRVLHVGEALGIPRGTRVWPVLVKYTLLSHWGSAPNDGCSRTDQSQFYYFFKNEFGDWGSGLYANSENSTVRSHPYVPCSTMPGSEIFNKAP